MTTTRINSVVDKNSIVNQPLLSSSLLSSSLIEQSQSSSSDLFLSSSSFQKKKKCPITSISQLSNDELYPKQGQRHMVTPPNDDGKKNITLVCCETTKGYFSALLHYNWAPIGVTRLVDMIRSGYFSTSPGIPLFRCMLNDACQFGLSGNPNMTKLYDNKRIIDDPLWLPTGPTNRQNEYGVKRYPIGFWTFAGSGRTNTRSNQFVITLQPNKFMGGGSPWEVPLGELVGNTSYETISKWYTGYGQNKGPSQRILRQEGYSNEIQQKYPLMDLILNCNILQEEKK